MNNGWIKVHRKIVDWEWYQHDGVFRVFFHLLVTANHEERQWQGTMIGIGQKITSQQHLSHETGLSLQSVRTALEKLKSTGEITVQTNNKYSLVTILNWKDYQQQTDKLTDKKQSTNNQLTTNKNDKNIRIKEIKNIYGEFKNVLLSEEEYIKLMEALNADAVSMLVTELDSYIESTGKNYKSHYATLQNWARRRIKEHAGRLKAPNVIEI